MIQKNDNYRWYILGLAILTDILIAAIPSMAVSVLARRISTDLNLNLVQVGWVWGLGALPGILTSLLGGAAGDRFGARRVMMTASLLTGVLGALRGLAWDFSSMIAMTILIGAMMPFVTMNALKIAGTWFPREELSLANALLSMGMALGFLLGAILSDSVLAPVVGGWRGVMVLYGVLGAVICIPWYFAREAPVHTAGASATSMRRSISKVAQLKNVWLLGLVFFGVGSGIQGLLGYLPLHLRLMGWAPVSADAALSTFHLLSLVSVMPITLLSRRLGSRKRQVAVLIIMEVLGIGLLSVATGGLVWVGVALAGFVRDAFMGLFLTMVIETKGVGPWLAGSATGLVMALGGIGSSIAPALGNSLDMYWSGAPFVFWSGLAVFGLACLMLVKHEVYSPEDDGLKASVELSPAEA